MLFFTAIQSLGGVTSIVANFSDIILEIFYLNTEGWLL
jgi:hypothetical protein